MMVIFAVVGAATITTVLWEAFETIILPRRIIRSRRLTSLFYQVTWRPWVIVAQRIRGEQARLTFAMARHAAGDLGQIFRSGASSHPACRQPPPPPAELRTLLGKVGVQDADDTVYERLTMLRGQYEASVETLSSHLLMPLPSWRPSETVDIWQTTAWVRDDGRAEASPPDRRSGESVRPSVTPA